MKLATVQLILKLKIARGLSKRKVAMNRSN
ncbi:hypothetical protein F383_03551 [Gossypium arboreum]|uniref:Uncharacterized protein n=1 Tax=Gossypium arboreum TaxID=29729 RepID=A0A0B0P9S3_GOSAR|nr:hypothetical protein F383_03551 [Gossypium arboreum]